LALVDEVECAAADAGHGFSDSLASRTFSLDFAPFHLPALGIGIGRGLALSM